MPDTRSPIDITWPPIHPQGDTATIAVTGEPGLSAPPVATCNRCGRKSWAHASVNTEDRMNSAGGYPCGGRFIRAT